MKTKSTVVKGTKALFTLLLSGVIGWTGIVSPGGGVLQADAAEGSAPRLVENLGRGLTAIYLGENKVYLSWRLLGTEPQQVAFDIYRRTGTEEVKLNDQPLTQGTNYTDTNVDVTQSHTYIVKSYVDGSLQDTSDEVVLAANPSDPQLFQYSFAKYNIQSVGLFCAAWLAWGSGR
ncbi:hypothetical protein Q0F98_27280 [Paenibacillus amylolyticus]|nr:hypothetical protein Q0F98_27280 [Paenibacillus amylolyticus]